MGMPKTSWVTKYQQKSDSANLANIRNEKSFIYFLIDVVCDNDSADICHKSFLISRKKLKFNLFLLFESDNVFFIESLLFQGKSNSILN